MGALANQSFVKMNGIGNEIVVVDLRAQAAKIEPDEARAVAQGVPYDQLMALYPPRTAGTDAFIRIYNNDGSEAGACGNGMRCVADIGRQAKRQKHADFRNHRRHSELLERRGRPVHRGHGQAAFHVERNSA